MSMVLDRYKRRLMAIPSLKDFCDKADRLIQANDPETLWNAKSLFAELISSSFLEDFVVCELGLVADNPFYFMFGSSEFGAPIVETAAYSLAVKHLYPETLAADPIIPVTEHILVSACGNGRVGLEVFGLEKPYRNEVFDRSNRLKQLEKIELVEGVIAQLPAGTAFRLQLQKPAVLIQLFSKTVVSLRWNFDSKTLEPVRATAAKLSSSRLQFTCHTLGVLGSPTSIPALKKLATHPEHYVRWAAIQGICAISRIDGMESLNKALSDDHPHIRNAAQKTLENC